MAYDRRCTSVIVFCICLLGLLSSGGPHPARAAEPAVQSASIAPLAIPFFDADVVVVIDHSALALVASGIDVDANGIVGIDRRDSHETGFHPEPARFWTTDRGDTVRALQLQVARALVERLALRKNRVGLTALTLRVRRRADTRTRLTEHMKVQVPVGKPERVLAAIDDFPVAHDGMRTDLSLLLERGEDLLDEAAANSLSERPRAILLLYIGKPSAPDGVYWSSRRAVARAAELAERGIALWAIPMRPGDHKYLDELTRRGGGGVIPLERLDALFGVPTT